MLDWIKEGTLGPWTVKHFDISKDQAAIYAISCYGSYEIAPHPGKYTGLFHKERGVIMSDTRQEMVHLYDFSCMLNGDMSNEVHINGLGLGIAVKIALDKRFQVEVIEIDPNVIQLVGTQLLALYPNTLTIIQADALEWLVPKHKFYAAVWHDIWDEASDDNWDQYKLLMRRYGRHTKKQNAWGRYHILRQKREERNWRYR
jgi:hypothetical protein